MKPRKSASQGFCNDLSFSNKLRSQGKSNEAFEVMLETERDFEEKVISFKKRYESLMQAVASQAAIAIENNRMLKKEE